MIESIFFLWDSYILGLGLGYLFWAMRPVKLEVFINKIIMLTITSSLEFY